MNHSQWVAFGFSSFFELFHLVPSNKKGSNAQMIEYKMFGLMDPFKIVSIFTHQLIRYEFYSFPLFSNIIADVLSFGSRTFTIIEVNRHASVSFAETAIIHESSTVTNASNGSMMFCLRFVAVYGDCSFHTLNVC